MTRGNRPITRLRHVLALAALLVTSVAPASATRPDTRASAFNSVYFTFYADGTKTEIVGYGYRECDGTYEQIYGIRTPYYTITTFPC